MASKLLFFSSTFVGDCVNELTSLKIQWRCICIPISISGYRLCSYSLGILVYIYALASIYDMSSYLHLPSQKEVTRTLI